ncbi:Ger(x)C family spore germination protein [Alkalihalobacillus sp. 1P02AB]|uniref:Ger(x)C family spore germination protein n=1 Tax=Alkalihalobacillus sp. 1P02AB TaxID=3132260 RepID=UPI0039A710E0
MMQIKKIKLIFIVLITLFLTGCWDLVDIQDINYVVAVGLDYDPEREVYISYAQMLDFSFVAKQEQPPGQDPVVYIGRGEGKSVNMSLTNLYKTAQMKTLWSHVTTVVFTERLLESGIEEVIDGYTRFSETRLSQWAFATNEPIDQLFATPAFFNLSTLLTLLHKPHEILEQRTFALSTRLKDVVIELTEPAKTVQLPSLTINSTQWKKNEELTEKMEYDGIYFVKDNDYKGFLPLRDYQGLHWVSEETERYPIFLEVNGEEIGVLTIEGIKVKKKMELVAGQPVYHLDIKLEAQLLELLKEMEDHEVQKIAEKIVKKQVRDTFLTGVEKEIDLYGLEFETYVHHYREWEPLKENFPLQAQLLGDISVEIDVVHSGLLKFNQSAEHTTRHKRE